MKTEGWVLSLTGPMAAHWSGSFGAPLSEVWADGLMCRDAPSSGKAPHHNKPSKSERKKNKSCSSGKKRSKTKSSKAPPPSESSSSYAPPPSVEQLCQLYDTGIIDPRVDMVMNKHQRVAKKSDEYCSYSGPGLKAGGGDHGIAMPYDDPRSFTQFAPAVHFPSPRLDACPTTDTKCRSGSSSTSVVPLPMPNDEDFYASVNGEDEDCSDAGSEGDGDEGDDDDCPPTTASVISATTSIPRPPRDPAPHSQHGSSSSCYPHSTANILNLNPAVLPDLGLYAISGVLLIFILEQFVQMGMYIRGTAYTYT